MKILVVSSYPEKNQLHGKNTVGVASYTKNTLMAMKKARSDLKIKVLAEVFDKKETYMEKGIVVRRVWQRNSLFSLIGLVGKILKEKSERVVFPFEIYMYGNILATTTILFGIFLCRLSKKKNYLILHHVIEDFRPIEKNEVRAFILNVAKSVFYRIILFLSYRVIVFEERFRQVLNKSAKVVVVPHGLETVNPVDKTIARRKLGLDKNIFYVLCFGYLSYYKGIDLLIDIWKKKNGARLIIGGNINPNHIKNKKNISFVELIMKKVRKSKSIVMADFVEEKDIPFYYSAADLVVFPYRTFFSSSGPLSLAFSFQKPVLISSHLSSYFESADWQKASSKSGIHPCDICFDLNRHDLDKKINFVKNNREKLTLFAQVISRKRSWNRIGHKYLRVLEL
jgi:glycosyltransferase involved in cell wall biosynthesis